MSDDILDSPITDDDAAPTIIACAAESGRRAAVLTAAIREAASQHARLVLYDIDAASSWVDSRPEFDPHKYDHLLAPDELRALGRSQLAEQVEGAAARGVLAFGWLPRHQGADAMVDYARDLGATTVMLSAELESPSFIQRVHHLTAARARTKAAGELAVVVVSG